jgi:hypothetical protein
VGLFTSMWNAIHARRVSAQAQKGVGPMPGPQTDFPIAPAPQDDAPASAKPAPAE